MAQLVDGRHVRRAKNRDAVIDAMVTLFEAGDYAPNADTVAARAGISVRSLFRYFDDVNDLARAAIERQLDAIGPFLHVDMPASAPTVDKAEALAATRERMFEVAAPTARAARIAAHRHALIAAQLDRVRGVLRDDIRRLFAPELRGARASRLLPAVDALCSFETYDLMRVSLGMSRAKVVDAIRVALIAMLDRP